MRIPHRRNPNKANKIKKGAMVIYACIVSFIADQQWPPSVSELAEMSNYRRGSVSRYLDWLEVYRYIERGENHEPRTIRVVDRETL